MTVATETKCAQCGRWQIKLTYCPYCGHRHTPEYFDFDEDDYNKVYTFEIKEGEYPPIVRFKENKNE
jgi:ribosomal protein L32